MSAPRPQSAGSPVAGPRARSLNSRVLQVAAFALSFILVAGLVVTSSRAAFVAQNDNTANMVSSATIELTDNDGTTAMFNVSGLVPGSNQVRCIQVTYTGDIDPTAVRLYRSSAPTGDLAPYLNLLVEAGTMPATTAFSGCTGFSATATEYNGTLDGFATARMAYTDPAALTTWDPTASGETRAFRFTVSVQDVAAAEGKSTNFGFSWETRTS